MSQSPSSSVQGWRLPRRVAYVVNHSYPYSSDGYAVRTHEIARALVKRGHDVIVFNRPGHPWDADDFPSDQKVAPEQVIDGVRYVFLPSDKQVGMNRRARLRQAERTLLEAFEIFRPNAVIAVSNWENAEPAQYAARRFGAAFHYEQRGFWEMTHATCNPGYEDSEEYQRDRTNELQIAKAAKLVFTLSGAMRDELVARGVDRNKILLVPNGVSRPNPTRVRLDRKDIGCTSRYLLGYVGSLKDYEGTQDLLRLVSTLRKDGLDVDLMVVGSGAPKGLVGTSHVSKAEQELRAEIERLGLRDAVHLIAQVEQSQVGPYYSLMDAMIMPRHSTPVTDLVPALKPYTAAAYGVPMFLSDLAPLVEMAPDIHASIFPEGNIPELARMVRHTLEHGGHLAVLNTLKPEVFWDKRVDPMVRALQQAEQTTKPLSDVFGSTASPHAASAVDGEAPKARFDAHILPRVALRGNTGADPVAAIGPCAHLSEDTQITRLTRANLLSELALGDVGCFIIDWAGLQEDPGEWSGLWSIANMRLNRQIMDACRIALDQGWRLQVIGPVLRSRAPLFRTVADVFEEIQPPQPMLEQAEADQDAQRQEASA
jgi:glycosyltransferase involved in cell wall biosynthesis